MQSSKYLEFVELPPKPKTKVFLCRNKMSGDELGTIQWYPAFRKYAYISNSDIVYDGNCLTDIRDFVIKLNEEHLENRNNHKTQIGDEDES